MLSMTIGEAIKERRLELGMTQDELAKKVGYKSRSSINKIELSRDIPLNRLKIFADALDISPSVLIGLTRNSKEKQLDDQLILDDFPYPEPDVNFANNLLHQLDDDDLVKIETRMQGMLASDKYSSTAFTSVPMRTQEKLTPDEHNLLTAYRSLDDEAKERVLAHAKLEAEQALKRKDTALA